MSFELTFGTMMLFWPTALSAVQPGCAAARIPYATATFTPVASPVLSPRAEKLHTVARRAMCVRSRLPIVTRWGVILFLLRCCVRGLLLAWSR